MNEACRTALFDFATHTGSWPDAVVLHGWGKDTPDGRAAVLRLRALSETARVVLNELVANTQTTASPAKCSALADEAEAIAVTCPNDSIADPIKGFAQTLRDSCC
jgi:hypothetical protein